VVVGVVGVVVVAAVAAAVAERPRCGEMSDPRHATTRSRPSNSMFSTSAAGRGGLKR